MSTADRNRQALVTLGVMLNDVFVGVAQEAQRSIVEGSEFTGAPGQPVDTGNLKGSWQLMLTPQTATLGTSVVYAEPIEDGVGQHGPLTLRSKTGGFHSVKMTVANFDRIVDTVTRRVARGEA